MNAKYVLLIILLLPIVLQPQAIAYYSGTVKNTDNQPIENVSVAAAGAAENVISNQNGNFLISFNELIYDSSVSVGQNYVRIFFFHPDYTSTSILAQILPGDSLTGNSVTLDNKPESYTVAGKVTYEDDTPIKNGLIEFFNADGITGHNYFTYPDAEGNYSISVPQGYYYVRSRAVFKDEAFPPSWAQRFIYFNGSEDLEGADLLEVFSDITALNFVHKSLKLGYISGKVVDEQTNLPLGEVGISITSMPKTDSLFIGTDDQGNFRIKVFEGEYSVFAYKPGYNLNYYNNVTTLFEATPVVVTEDNLDVTGIDFKLIPFGNEQNSISGSVYDKDSGLPVPDVEVYAIPLNSGNWIQSAIRPDSRKGLLRKTDNNGAYTLRNIKSGSYVLLFYKPNYLNAYNGETTEWEKAPVLVLTGNTNLSVDVNLRRALSFGGEISGTILYSDSGVSGTLISAFNESGDVVASGISSHDGKYNVPFIDQGRYTLKASYVGKPTVEYDQKININLVTNLAVDGIDIALEKPTGVDDEKSVTGYRLNQNYPNPFNPSTIISFVLPEAGHVKLTIYDILGNKIASLINEEMSSGQHEINFEAKNLASGIYIYKLETGSYIKLNKMLLLR